MNSTNLTAEAALDNAYLDAAAALLMIESAQKGEYDIDLYACTIHYVSMKLKNMMTDLEAAGAEPLNQDSEIEYETIYSLRKAA